MLVSPKSLNLVLVNLSPKESLFVSVCLYVCDKVFSLSLRLSGSNLQAISQQAVSQSAYCVGQTEPKILRLVILVVF